MSDCDTSAPCSVGIRQARRFHAQHGSVMNVWIEDSDHIFGRTIGTWFWTQLNTYLYSFHLIFCLYNKTCFTKKYALINITTLNIIFHKFHQFPSIFQPFPDTMVFSIPFQRFPTSKVALTHRPTRAIGGSKSTPCLGARDMGRILFAQNEI